MFKMEESPWYCVRQRLAFGQGVPAIRPRLSKDDNRSDRREKQEIIHSPHSAVCRTQADRLELRLALFWYEGLHHTLTYDSTHMPPDFKAVRATLRAFMGRPAGLMRVIRLIGSTVLRACTAITATTSTWCCGIVISRQL